MVMTSDEAVKKAIGRLDNAATIYSGELARARAKEAAVWMQIAEFLREKENNG